MSIDKIVQKTDAIAVATQFLEEIVERKPHAYVGDLKTIIHDLKCAREELWTANDDSELVVLKAKIEKYQANLDPMTVDEIEAGVI